MRNFDYQKLAQQKWDSEILLYVAKIHEYKGRQDLYIRQKPVELERLVEVARIQSTEASNKIEGIVTTSARIKQLCQQRGGDTTFEAGGGGESPRHGGGAGSLVPLCGLGRFGGLL